MNTVARLPARSALPASFRTDAPPPHVTRCRATLPRVARRPTAWRFAAALLLAGAAAAQPVTPVLGTPGAHASGGIGQEDQERMRLTQALYNLRIVFAEAGTGAYLADVEVTIAPIGPGPSYGPFREAGPLLYVVVKPGTYRIHATYGGLTRTADVKVGKGTAALTLYWPQTPG